MAVCVCICMSVCVCGGNRRLYGCWVTYVFATKDFSPSHKFSMRTVTEKNKDKESSLKEES